MMGQEPKGKKLVWVRSSYDNLCCFARVARQKAGFQLRRVKESKLPEDWKPMPTSGQGQ